ncbi:MAG TPA: LPS biosynthesis protein WbpP [Verrucomicrobiales bacterium]|nr:LPS biosynthesis protein WbpP [Verrucomicrobiales bacterium]
MIRNFTQVRADLVSKPSSWLVTGAAGFIGSHLLQTLLGLGQRVVAMDNFATGYRRNLDQVRDLVGPEAWSRCRFLEADIRDADACAAACQGAEYVLHQAALGSVPRSIEDPLTSNAANVTGFVNMAWGAHKAGVRRFVYASSSAVYGDHPDLPKVEERIGGPLSPYAVTKFVNEVYGEVFARCYGLRPVGLRYFNVFGPRQDPDGAYAAVIPRWIASLIKGEPILINGDGETSRDFCYIANVVQANILAAVNGGPGEGQQVFNVALNQRTTLNELFALLRDRLLGEFPHLRGCTPVYREFRAGDVRHSQADITKARTQLGYEPTHDIAAGLDESLAWYKANVVR